MEDALRASDVIARYAGDEFVVYLDDKEGGITQEDCAAIAKKLIKCVEEPVHFEGNEIKISLCIGIAIFPTNGNSYETLIDAADKAMYKVKAIKTEPGIDKFIFADSI